MDDPANILPIPSEELTPRLLAPTQTLLIPLESSEQASSLDLLSAGTVVRRGQSLIHSPRQGHPTPLASVEGTLGSVVTARLFSGQSITAVQLHPTPIQADANDAQPSQPVSTPGDLAESTHLAGIKLPDKPGDPIKADLPTLDLPTMISRLCAGQVRVDRVGSPNLIGQLVAAMKQPVETILCSSLEIDPSSRTMANTPLYAHLSGVSLLAKATGAASVQVVYPDTTDRRVIKLIRRQASALGIKLITTSGDYPASHPTVLLHRLYKKRLRPRRLPTDVGVLLIDAQGAADVSRCILLNEPMLTCLLDIQDWSRKRCLRLRVPVGMTLGQAMQLADNLSPPPESLRVGALYRNVPVGLDAICAGGEITVHILPDLGSVDVHPCVRAGWCVDVCPTRVHPAGLVEAAQRKDLSMAEDYGLNACIECGMCAWVCPSHLPLLQSIRAVLRLQQGDSSPEDKADR